MESSSFRSSPYLAVVCLGIASGLLLGSWYVYEEINWKEAFFSHGIVIDSQCKFSIEAADGNSLAYVDKNESFLQTFPVPFRGQARRPRVLSPQEKLIGVCDLGDVNLSQHSFAWLDFGPLVGGGKIWVNSTLVVDLPSTGWAEASLTSVTQRKGPLRIVFESFPNKEGLSGPATLAPPRLVFDPSHLQISRKANHQFTGSHPNFRVGILVGLLFLFGVLILFGFNYPDVEVLALSLFLVMLSEFNLIASGLLGNTNSVKYLSSMLELATYISLCHWLACFSARRHFKRMYMFYLLPPLVWLVPGEIFYSLRMQSSLPSLIGSCLMFMTTFLSFQLRAREINRIAVRRKWLSLAFGSTFGALFLCQGVLVEYFAFDLVVWSHLLLLCLLSVFVIQDIAVRRKEMTLLKTQRELLEKKLNIANRLKALTDTVVHDLKRPLHYLNFWLSDYRKNRENADPDVNLLFLDKANGDMQRIVDELLRPRAIEDLSVEEEFDLLSLIKEVIEGLIVQSGSSTRPHLDADCLPSFALIYRGSKRLLELTLSNLIKNAIEAEKSVDHVHVIVRIADGFVVVDIENPSEIPVEIRKNIFKKYFSHGKSAGTGLGLSSVKECVDLLGGSIILMDTVAGTQFRLKLPYTSSCASESVGSNSHIAKDADTVLVIDDDLTLGLMIQNADPVLQVFTFETPEDFFKQDFSSLPLKGVVLLDQYFGNVTLDLEEIVSSIRRKLPDYSVYLCTYGSSGGLKFEMFDGIVDKDKLGKVSLSDPSLLRQ